MSRPTVTAFPKADDEFKRRAKHSSQRKETLTQNGYCVVGEASATQQQASIEVIER